MRLFEKLCLEGFQSGLSWRTILAKRENFRLAFEGFDFHKLAHFGEQHVERRQVVVPLDERGHGAEARDRVGRLYPRERMVERMEKLKAQHPGIDLFVRWTVRGAGPLVNPHLYDRRVGPGIQFLIEECGTEPETGAYLYRTTVLFLEKLGLNSVDQLPPLAPFLPDDVEEVLDASG